MLMQKVVIRGERQAALTTVEVPAPREDWVLVKVRAVPMCTEYKMFVAGQQNEYLGHEAAGEVVALAQPGRVALGDRVVVMPQYPCGKCHLCVAGDYIHCEHNSDYGAFVGSPEGRATMAQYLLKPDWLLPKIPDGVSYEHASLACCALGPSFGAFDAMRLGAFDTVLITGAGAVGMGAIVNARYRGSRVLVVESIPWRVSRARELGAAEVIDPADPDAAERVRDLTEGIGADCALDCSGAMQAQRLCIDATRRKGHVAFVGECHDALPIRSSADMLRKGLVLFGSWHYNLSLFPQIMQVIRRSPLIDQLISHVIPMSEIQRAFEVSSSHECAKIILKPWE